MFIIGLGTAAPSTRYTQLDCWRALENSSHLVRLKPRSQAILKKVLTGKNGISTRHLALDPLTEAFNISPDTLLARFTRNAPALAAEAAARALRDAQTTAQEIDAIIISTCTGYLCPGLTSYVSERLGLRASALTFDLVGQGCGAAMPNLRMAESLIASGQSGRVLSICVEVCSAAFYLDDDPGVLISACLFGDGAAAAVLGPEPLAGRRKVRWKTAASTLSPEDRDFLRFETSNGLLRNVLAPCVPTLAARHARSVFDSVMRGARIEDGKIAAWILHAGGREVLAALRGAFCLTEDQICWSAGVLNEYGNISSPFVLFTLQAALAGSAPDGLWWMTSFGAGFSCHGAILEVGG
jgi:alkylresorcinol/alkylpyrone synthase